MRPLSEKAWHIEHHHRDDDENDDDVPDDVDGLPGAGVE
jgi:hypothetical protein